VPSVGDSGNWLPISDYLPKFSAEGSDNFLLKTFYPLISANYRLNSDVGEYLIVARDFSPEYLEGHQYLNRPLYPFLIFLISKSLSPVVGTSYGILFGISIFLNFILIFATVTMFYQLLLKIFKQWGEPRAFKISFLSAVLLIFSPFAHSLIIQPMPEMFVAFGVIFSLFLLYNYIQNPTLIKLAVFAFLGGTMMLGKMFFALPLFILILSFYYRRFREGAIFLLCFAMPAITWYLWVTKVWGIPYYVHEVQHWNMGIWIFSVFKLSKAEIVKIFVDAAPRFITAIFRSFVFLPVIFAIIGAWHIKGKGKSVLIYSITLSIFIMSFLIHLYLYRHAFMLFPVVFPAAVVGIQKFADYAAKKRRVPHLALEVASFAAIFYFSSLNIYKFYNYLSL